MWTTQEKSLKTAYERNLVIFRTKESLKGSLKKFYQYSKLGRINFMMFAEYNSVGLLCVDFSVLIETLQFCRMYEKSAAVFKFGSAIILRFTDI